MEKKSKKSKVTEAAPVAQAPVKQTPPTVEEMIAGTEAGNIWNEIRFKEIQMFALPGQTISYYCKPAIVEPSKLYLLTTATSVLPSLEQAVGKKYIVESIDKYTVVSRAPVSPFTKK